MGDAFVDGIIAAVNETISKVEPAKRPVMRTPDGRELPAGRQKGVPNKVTRTIREAVEMAARDCHPKGLAGWLVERAQGGVQDRQIFAQMVAKALPLQVNANVDGAIKLDLGWLSSRAIGTATAQPTLPAVQVVDVLEDSAGVHRIADQSMGQNTREILAEADPLPPVDRQGGGVG